LCFAVVLAHAMSGEVGGVFSQAELPAYRAK
jgi:hypothetical protein